MWSRSNLPAQGKGDAKNYKVKLILYSSLFWYSTNQSLFKFILIFHKVVKLLCAPFERGVKRGFQVDLVPRLNGGFEPNQGEPLNQINLKSFIKLIWGNAHVTDLKTVTRITLDKEKA